LPTYKTFQAAAREWINEKPPRPSYEDSDWEWNNAGWDWEIGEADDGNPLRHEHERMIRRDSLAAEPKRIKLRTPTAYQQLERLAEKFSDIPGEKFSTLPGESYDPPAASACDHVKRLISEVAVHKGVYPTEKVLETLFATALYAGHWVWKCAGHVRRYNSVPMKVILSRVTVSRRAIMNWLDEWDIFVAKQQGRYDETDEMHLTLDEDFDRWETFLSQDRAPHINVKRSVQKFAG
jgi:hypothetical protein